MGNVRWENSTTLPSRNYSCGYCGQSLASEKGYRGRPDNSSSYTHLLYFCHFCDGPTFFDNQGKQWPGSPFRGAVADIPEKSVSDLYNEARYAFGAGAFTATVLSCRKLLMHISVTKGAKPGQDFFSYVDFLSANHYVPPGSELWVDKIRTKGNEANHEINIMARQEAEDMLSFCEMLLRIIFEFPAKAKKA